MQEVPGRQEVPKTQEIPGRQGHPCGKRRREDESKGSFSERELFSRQAVTENTNSSSGLCQPTGGLSQQTDGLSQQIAAAPFVDENSTVEEAMDALRRELQERLGEERVELWLDQQVTFELDGWSPLDGRGSQQKHEDSKADGTTETVPNGLTLRVGVSTQFHLNWLKRRLLKPLRACCQRAWQQDVTILFQEKGLIQKTGLGPGGKPISKERGSQPPEQISTEHPARVQLDVQGAKKGQPDPRSRSSSAASPKITNMVSTRRKVPTRKSPQKRPTIEGRKPRPSHWQTFATFVSGSCNTLAHGTAELVVEQPGRYCPLLLYGQPGVGKSHLLSAIRQQARRQTPRMNAIGLTSEEFTTQFLEALNRRSLPSFRQKYRTVDVLLVDDIQFLARKRATLEELLYTIDTLHHRGSQIVLASDRGPSELQKVSTELVSRISSGLAIPMDLPDYETRVGIVRNLGMRMKVDLDEEVVSMIASQVTGSARQLRGALNRLLAGSVALGQPITPELARPALTEFSRQNTPSVRLPDIQRAVCEVFGVEPASLKSNRKSRSVTEPRMLAMWLARKYTRSALSEISDFFGRRSHSTVISANKKVESLLKARKEITVADRPCHLEEAIRRVESALRKA